MTTDVLEGTDIARSNSYRPGLIDRVLQIVDRLPGPAYGWWAAVGIALAVIGHILVWMSTERPLGVIHDDIATPALIFAWFAWLTHTLNRVATVSFDEFRPVLGDPGSEHKYRYQLTHIHDGRAVLAAVIAVAVVSFAYYVGVRPLRVPAPAEIERISSPLWGLTAAALGVVVLHTLTQNRLVSRLSAVARNVDIFKPGPINAFSRLTVVSAIGLILFVIAFVLFSPEQPIAYIIQEAIVMAIAVASFVLPLRIMHNRLVVEKARLLAESQDRLKAVLTRIHEQVDANQLDRAEQLHHTLTAVLAERDVLAKLHTWPWSAGTFRGFASALLLPILLIMFTQFVDRLL